MRAQNVGSVIMLSSALLIVGCSGGGGSGDGNIPPPVPNAAVGGLWAGETVIAGLGTYELIGIVAEDGRAYFVQEDGVMYWGTANSSGNQITASLNGAGLLGSPLSDGSTSSTGSVNGTIVARASMSANSTFTTARGSRTTGTISLSYEPSYDDDSSLALIAGNYVDALGLYAGVLNIASNGDVFLQDPDSGCVINGRIGIINSAYNAYDMQFSYNGCTGLDAAFNGVTFRGLASYDQEFEQAVALVHGSVGGIPYPNAFVFDRL